MYTHDSLLNETFLHHIISLLLDTVCERVICYTLYHMMLDCDLKNLSSHRNHIICATSLTEPQTKRLEPNQKERKYFKKLIPSEVTLVSRSGIQILYDLMDSRFAVKTKHLMDDHMESKGNVPQH